MSDKQKQNEPRMGIIISMFPELHETFILRELVALEKRGLAFDIYSLQYPRDPITLDDAIRLSTERTHYAKLISLTSLSAFVATLLSKPVKTLSAIARVAWVGKDRPAEVIKNLAILPLTLQFWSEGQKRGITHWHGHWANIPTTACWYLQQIHGASWSAAIHGEDIFSKNQFLQYKLDDASFSVVCSGYFCNHLKTQLGLKTPQDVHLNYHGLDPRVMERIKDTPREKQSLKSSDDQSNDPQAVLNLVSIGRLVPTKGHDVLIKACAMLKHEHGLTISLQLIGSGPIEGELKALAVDEDVAEEVQFTGGLAFAKVLETLENADMFCLAPRLIPGQPPDGIPNVIAEAMALRVPVVSTRVSAIPELIEDGVTGRLAEVDDVDGFAKAILSLAKSAELSQSISNAGYEKVGKLFNQQNNIDELLELFDRYVPGQVLPDQSATVASNAAAVKPS